jgi:hypothetical protein
MYDAFDGPQAGTEALPRVRVCVFVCVCVRACVFVCVSVFVFVCASGWH